MPGPITALGYTYLFRRRFDDALAEFELALHLNPNFAMAHAFYGVTLCYAGRWQDGDVAARRALRLSPRDPLAAIYCGVAAYAQFIGRNYERRCTDGARIDAAARRFRRRASRADGRRRHVRRSAQLRLRPGRTAHAAQPGISLAWITRELPMLRGQRDREHYLEGFGARG